MSNINWFKKAIIYHILIDRFAGYSSTKNWDKPIFIGGNLKGIIKKLPYLKKLGVNTLWISPFYNTNVYHGYHITDFYKIDPNFGTILDLKKLIKTVHETNMHIIADFVPNHCSKDHLFFKDAQNKKNSKYKKWFYFIKWPSEYQCFLRIKELPKINLNYPPAREHIINSAKYWLNFGLDGYRLDHVIGPSHDFWKNFYIEIKNEYPQSVLIGEAWMQGIKYDELKTINIKRKFLKWFFKFNSDSLLLEYVGELDGVLDFRFREIINDYILKIIREDERQKINIKLKHHYKRFPVNYFLPTFLDNHDMNRFLFECKNDKEIVKKAASIQFSLDQPAIIYYGTEVGMNQEKSIWDFSEHGDLQARRPMNWYNQDKELFNFYKKLIEKKSYNISENSN
jgi:glycosidase